VAVDLVTGSLLLLDVGFLGANARLAVEYWQFLQRRPRAVLTWPPPRPPLYPLTIALGIATGLLVLVKTFIVRREVFGELMMFVYFGYLVHLRQRIGRGFYQDGIWADSAFMPYSEIGGLTWRDGERSVSLVVSSRVKNLARTLAVPLEHYGAARRLLRDKIGEHAILLHGAGLDLGVHDERDDA
jgi:hypothetical protein